jgi:biopolymer transport protein ExbB/TolQ
MKSLSQTTRLGIVLVTLSPLVGLAGTIWSIYRSFGALATNESSGSGAVGAEILKALFFTICGLLGAFAGILLIVRGTRRARLP